MVTADQKNSGAATVLFSASKLAEVRKRGRPGSIGARKQHTRKILAMNGDHR